MSVDKKPVLVPLETPISQVSAGNLFSVAVEEGGSRVFLWGTFNSFGSSITAHPTEVQSITALLKRHHTKVKKIVACEQAVAFLTENGKLFVFGDSNQGQLGINQIREDIYDTHVSKPVEVFQSYEGQITDFDLGDNVMVFLTDVGKVYFSGIWKYFVPTEVALPKGTTVQTIAAGHNGFGVVDSKGRVLGWNGFVDTPKKYFDLNLSVADSNDFEGKKVVKIGGRYGGRYAFAL